MEYWALWLIVVILLAIIEASTVNLVSIWFVASGIVTIFVSMCVNSFMAQFAIFVVLGIILMLLTKPALTKYFHNEENKTNLERILGMEAVVTEDIKKNQVGEVKVDGKHCSDIADKTIKKDEIVQIKRIDGVKLVVEKKVEEKENNKTETKKKEVKQSAKKKTTSKKKKES